MVSLRTARGAGDSVSTKHQTLILWRHSFHAMEHTHFKGSVFWELTSICKHTATLWPRCSVCPSSGHCLLAPQQLVHFPGSGLRQGLPCFLPWKINLLQGHIIEVNHRASFARVACLLHIFEAYVCSGVVSNLRLWVVWIIIFHCVNISPFLFYVSYGLFCWLWIKLLMNLHVQASMWGCVSISLELVPYSEILRL